VVGLIGIVEETLVACFTAGGCSLVVKGIGVEVADLQGLTCKEGNRRRVFHELAQNTRSALRCLVEEDLVAFPEGRHGFAGEFPGLKLIVFLDRFLKRRLQARHLVKGPCGLQAHYQSVLRIRDIGNHSGLPCAHGILGIIGVRCIVCPITPFEIEQETGWLVASLVDPTEIDPVKGGSIAVAQPHYKLTIHVHIRILAVEFPSDVGEPVRRCQPVTETLALFLVAGDPLRELQAHILKMDQIGYDRVGVEGGTATIADL